LLNFKLRRRKALKMAAKDAAENALDIGDMAEVL